MCISIHKYADLYISINILAINDNLDWTLAVTRTLKIFETCIFMYIHMYINKNSYIYIYTYKYVYIFINTYTYSI
jgi:hypothetical protein